MEKLFLILIFIYVSSANAASFDCKNAKAEIEIKICSDIEISALDEILYSHYTIAKNVMPSFEKLKNLQIDWLKARNMCQSNDCISKQYDNQIDKISYKIQDSEVDFIAASNYMLSQRGITLGISAKELEERLGNGNIDWGGCSTKECHQELGMVLNIYPLTCELKNYHKTRACMKPIRFPNYWVRFHIDNSNTLSKVTLNRSLILLGK